VIRLAMFNNKGGVGKTTLTYHLAHMYQRLGVRVLAVDLDPQSNLTAAFLNEDDLAVLWDEAQSPAWNVPQHPLDGWPAKTSSETGTIAKAVRPIMDGIGDIEYFDPVQILDGLWLNSGRS
jgi:chromosome partitioning protein